MTFTKLLLLLVTAIAQHYATTPPNTRPPTEELREQHGAEHMIPYFTAFLKILLWTWAIFEGLILFALNDHCPPTLARHFLEALLGPSFVSTTSLTTPTPAFVAGTLCSFAGALLRAHTFRVLGPRFTFELSIRSAAHTRTHTNNPRPAQAHALVTDGVYGVVRHPSYTGGVVLALGYLLCLLDRRGPTVIAISVSLARCQQWWYGYRYDAADGFGINETTVTAVLACVWMTALAMISAGVHARVSKEDAMLEKHFGKEWQAWAMRVPWRLIPGIY